MLILIPVGWLLALFVGAVTDPADLPIAFVCGFVSLILPFVANVSTVKADQEVTARALSYMSASTLRLRQDNEIEVMRADLHAARILLAVWVLLRGVSLWITALTPICVLWQLGG